MTLLTILLLLGTVTQVYCTACTDCVAGNKIFCATNSQCGTIQMCTNPITLALNCPDLPVDPAAYDDNFMRTKMLVLTAAASNDNPQICFNSKLPTMTLSKTFSVNCSAIGLQTNCFGFTAVDSTQKVIVLSFRGTQGRIQLFTEFMNIVLGNQKLFDGAGSIYTYFYNAFFFLWNGGLKEEVESLKRSYPDYEVWLTGHSLGGSIASIAASYLVNQSLFSPTSIKLVTMGQPRTGDYEYATWHDKTFPYSYRIVHDKDLVPHIPPQGSLFHHPTEVWYPNNMTAGDSFQVCAQADGLSCSGSVLPPSYDFPGHFWYFGVNVTAWGPAGCP